MQISYSNENTKTLTFAIQSFSEGFFFTAILAHHVRAFSSLHRHKKYFSKI